MENATPSSSPEPAPTEAVAWQSIFAGGSPREILARLVDGDPLGLGARCTSRVRSQALLLDEHRLHSRAVAHVARHAGTYRGIPPLDVWIAERIRKALTELLEEDDARRADARIPQAPHDPRLLAIADALGLEPALLCRGAALFNRAPYEVRSAFCGMLFDGVSPPIWAEANGVSADRARASLRRAFWILGVREEFDIDELFRGPEDGA